MRPTLIIGLTIVCLAPAARAEHPAGWLEPDSTTIEALLPTLGEGQLLVVEVSADWCVPCNQLRNEVLATTLAQQVIDHDVGLALDFDGAYGQAVKRKHGILGVPTTLVLDRAGAELGRVEGYTGAKEFVDALHEAKAGRFGLAALEAKVAADPSDVAAATELAQARLVRGDEPLGLRTLGKIIRTGTPDQAARAARIKGRWLLRVKEDGPAAIVHFKTMVERFAGTPHETQFLYWYAAALAKVGHPDQGIALFDAWIARAPSLDAKLLKADFMVQSGLRTAVTEPYVRELLLQAPDNAELHYLLSRIAEKRDDLGLAADEANHALRLAPTEAIYQNRAAQLAKTLGAPR